MGERTTPPVPIRVVEVGDRVEAGEMVMVRVPVGDTAGGRSPMSEPPTRRRSTADTALYALDSLIGGVQQGKPVTEAELFLVRRVVEDLAAEAAVAEARGRQRAVDALRDRPRWSAYMGNVYDRAVTTNPGAPPLRVNEVAADYLEATDG